MHKEVLFDKPRIVLYNDVFSKDECADLIKSIPSEQFFAAEGFDFVTKKGIPTDYRSNSSYIDKGFKLNPLHQKLTELIEGELIGTYPYIELPVQVQRYDVGQQYKTHVDFFNRANEPKVFDVDRIASIIVYLNDDFEGGETHFTTLNIKVKPKAGMALFFKYNYNDPIYNRNTFHAGIPVISGTKYIVTAFFRSEPLSYKWNAIDILRV